MVNFDEKCVGERADNPKKFKLSSKNVGFIRGRICLAFLKPHLKLWRDIAATEIVNLNLKMLFYPRKFFRIFFCLFSKVYTVISLKDSFARV